MRIRWRRSSSLPELAVPARHVDRLPCAPWSDPDPPLGARARLRYAGAGQGPRRRRPVQSPSGVSSLGPVSPRWTAPGANVPGTLVAPAVSQGIKLRGPGT